MMKFGWIGIILCLSVQVTFAQSTGDLSTQLNSLNPSQQKLYQEVADQLRCPTCTGLSILQSDAPFSQQIKAIVLEQVAQGKDEKAIIDFFTDRYGLWIRREPPASGFHILAWAIPLLLLIIGPLFIWLVFFRKSVTIENAGVRSAEDILAEMDQTLQYLRKG